MTQKNSNNIQKFCCSAWLQEVIISPSSQLLHFTLIVVVNIKKGKMYNFRFVALDHKHSH